MVLCMFLSGRVRRSSFSLCMVWSLGKECNLLDRTMTEYDLHIDAGGTVATILK